MKFHWLSPWNYRIYVYTSGKYFDTHGFEIFRLCFQSRELTPDTIRQKLMTSNTTASLWRPVNMRNQLKYQISTAKICNGVQGLVLTVTGFFYKTITPNTLYKAREGLHYARRYRCFEMAEPNFLIESDRKQVGLARQKCQAPKFLN